MPLPFMQTLTGQKSLNSEAIENGLVRPNFVDTYQMKKYPNVLKFWNIDGADKYTKIDTTDVISNIFLLFLADTCL